MNQNTNQTVIDPFMTDNFRRSVNDYYNPIKQIKNLMIDEKFIINKPLDFLPCVIELFYGDRREKPDDIIQILFPESFSESLSATFVKESPVGSDRPIVAFSHTNPQQVPITFVALSDYLPAGFTSLKQYITKIKQMVKPRYKGDSTVVSPWVKITFSNMVYEAVCDSIDIAYTNVYGNKTLVHATINCNFTVINELEL